MMTNYEETAVVDDCLLNLQRVFTNIKYRKTALLAYTFIWSFIELSEAPICITYKHFKLSFNLCNRKKYFKIHNAKLLCKLLRIVF